MEKNLPFAKSPESDLKGWNARWKRRKSRHSLQGEMATESEERTTPDNLLLALGNYHRRSIFKLYRLLSIACTLFIKSAEAKRSFTLMRRNKIYASWTVREERLTDLVSIEMEYGDRALSTTSLLPSCKKI